MKVSLRPKVFGKWTLKKTYSVIDSGEDPTEKIIAQSETNLTQHIVLSTPATLNI